ncbi:hypothetical protein ABZ341_23975 [Streptomyces sp. NPDC006173]|uniref:hypothetical protein n=1 Tax=Streptomyces sp. NPDC006173 TaxID=3155349 RepID=UPI0033D1CB53
MARERNNGPSRHAMNNSPLKRGQGDAELLTPGQSRKDDPSAIPRTAALAAQTEVVHGLSDELHQHSGTDTVEHQAVGIVMALGRLPACQARTVLTEVSQRTNITPLRIACLLTAWTSCGELNLGIRIALEDAIRTQRTAARPTGPAADY